MVLVVAVMCSIPLFLKLRIESDARNNGASYSTYAARSNDPEWRAFYRAYDAVMYVMVLSSVPLCILTLLTVRLVKAMKAHRRMQFEMNGVSNKQDNSVTSAFVIVVIMFIICHPPMFVSNLLHFLLTRYYHESIDVYCFMNVLAIMLVVLNSAVNFAIYLLSCKHFRDVLIENVCRRRMDMQVIIAHRAEGVNDEPDDDHDTPL